MSYGWEKDQQFSKLTIGNKIKFQGKTDINI